MNSFTGTPWELISGTNWLKDDELSQMALGLICEKYWSPVFSYIFAIVGNEPDALDYTQEFFTFFIKKSILENADQSKGRFRDLMKKSVKNYVLNQFKSEKRIKRGGHISKIPLDKVNEETEFVKKLSDQYEPEKIFESQWARSILNEVVEELSLAYMRKGKEEQFAVLQKCIFDEQAGGTYKELAEELGKTEVWVSTNVHRMRQKANKILRKKILETLENPEDLEGEVQHLLTSILS